MLRIGTSGYYYKDWVGPFYPEDLKAGDRLAFYAREFETVEINSSYYRMPTAPALEKMAARVPAGFVFTLKTPHEITHERNADASFYAQFRDALQPLIDAKKFGVVLAQFPYAFHNTPPNANYLSRLREQLRDLPVVVELRTLDWLTESAREKTLTLLRSQNLGFCSVDLPPIKSLPPPIVAATSQAAYVRFHGRNVAKWWEQEESYERYDYTYSAAELGEWKPRIQKLNELADVVYVFANNHYGGQAVDTARQLKLMF